MCIRDSLRDFVSLGEATPALGVKVIKNVSDAISRARKIFQNSSYEALIAGSPRLIEQILGGSEELVAGRERMVAVVSYEDDFVPKVDFPWLASRKRLVGVVPLIIADSARSLVFREDYVLEITEEGLLRLLLDFYYHSLWRTSTPIKHFEVEKGLTYTSTSLWLIKEVVSEALRNGFNVSIEVEGIDRRENKRKHVKGDVEKVVENSHGVTISLLVNVDGKTISIGGLGAKLEDIEGRNFRVHIKNREKNLL